MTLSEWLMIIAILFAPLFALQVQSYLSYFGERKRRKVRNFEILMTTRGERISELHVQALNMIDIDFYGLKFLGKNWRTKKEKNVLIAWKIYLDHLYVSGDLEGPKLETWSNKKDELFIDLLYEISKAVGYDFDKVQLNKSIYTPRAHGTQVLDNESIRQNLVQILDGKKPLPMRVVLDEENQKQQKIILQKYDDMLSGERALKIEIKNSTKE